MQKLTEYKPQQTEERWYLLDASKARLGKIANESARLLLGKDQIDKVDYIPNNVHLVIINSDKVKYHPKKADKKYYRHSGYISGLTEETLVEKLEKDSRKVLELAISGMLPKNKLRARYMANVQIYQADEHPHAGQKPEEVDLS